MCGSCSRESPVVPWLWGPRTTSFRFVCACPGPTWQEAGLCAHNCARTGRRPGGQFLASRLGIFCQQWASPACAHACQPMATTRTGGAGLDAEWGHGGDRAERGHQAAGGRTVPLNSPPRTRLWGAHAHPPLLCAACPPPSPPQHNQAGRQSQRLRMHPNCRNPPALLLPTATCNGCVGLCPHHHGGTCKWPHACVGQDV